MRHRLTPLLLLLATTPGAGEPLSRADAVAAALSANPAVKKSLQEQARLRGVVTEARADALPDISLVGSSTWFRDPSILLSGSFDELPGDVKQLLRPIETQWWDGTATLRQTLFSFKVNKALKAASYGAEFGAEQVRQARQATALQAVLAYNDYLLSLEKVRVAEKSVRQKEKHLEMARNRRAAGVATDLDVLRSQVDVQNQRTQMLSLEGLAALARGRLNAVMLQPIDTAIEPTDSLDFVPLEIPLEEAVKEAWASRPEAKAALLAEKVYEQLVGVAQGEARPSLEFNGAFGYLVRDLDRYFESDFQKWSAAVTLRVPVFDGLRTAGRVTQARAELGKAEQDTVALENQIRLEAKDAVDRLAVAKSVLETSELTVAQAQKALDMTQANYNAGAATTLDVLDAQAALTLAESNRIAALHVHANARATLRYVMARDVLDPVQGAQP